MVDEEDEEIPSTAGGGDGLHADVDLCTANGVSTRSPDCALVAPSVPIGIRPKLSQLLPVVLGASPRCRLSTATVRPPSSATFDAIVSELCAGIPEMKAECAKDMCTIGADGERDIAGNYKRAAADIKQLADVVGGEGIGWPLLTPRFPASVLTF